MLTRLALLLVIPCVAFVSGCASVTGSTAQSISVQTKDQSGREVAGAMCELANNKGKWYVTTPGSTTIVRSNDDMQVLCNKAGLEPGRASVVSATKGAMWGNILIGGGIGALVDHTSGAAYEYPSFFQVLMGSSVRVEPASPDVAGSNPGSGEPGGKNAPEGFTWVATPASPSSPASSSVPASAGKTTEERLLEIKKLHDAGLITNQVYLEQQRKILEAR